MRMDHEKKKNMKKKTKKKCLVGVQAGLLTFDYTFAMTANT